MPKPPPPPLPPQLDHEPDMAYSLACEYFSLGPKRSIRALSELTGRSRGTLGALSVRWLWSGRAAAWDRSHAMAPEPEESRVEVLGDRRARIAGAVDLAIALIADKLAAADPSDTPARSVASLVNSLKTCLDIDRELNPDLGDEFKAVARLIGDLHPEVLGAIAEHSRLLTDVCKGNLDAALSTIESDVLHNPSQDFLNRISGITKSP